MTTSKARVHAALRRQPVDRVPVFMWFHPATAVMLGRILAIPAGRVAEVMGDDIRMTWVNHNYAMEGVDPGGEGAAYVDDWGVEWVREGYFNQIRRYPLENATADDCRQYRYPYDRIDQLLTNMNPVLAAAEKKFIGCDVSPCLFEMVCRLRGIEMASCDVAGDPELMAEMLDAAGEFTLALARAACDRFPLDWLWTGDDVGGQQALMMSPGSWRQLVKPRLARIFAVAKQKKIRVAFHSCGAIREIIPDLIEIGLDVLNPVQCNCTGMNPAELKREFGKHLAFMGGVDTQELLPRGTADEVYRATVMLLETMTADGGGYILAASHTVPPETPPENIFAMYAAAGISRTEIQDRAAAIRTVSGESSARL